MAIQVINGVKGVFEIGSRKEVFIETEAGLVMVKLLEGEIVEVREVERVPYHVLEFNYEQ